MGASEGVRADAAETGHGRARGPVRVCGNGSGDGGDRSVGVMAVAARAGPGVDGGAGGMHLAFPGEAAGRTRGKGVSLSEGAVDVGWKLETRTTSHGTSLEEAERDRSDDRPCQSYTADVHVRVRAVEDPNGDVSEVCTLHPRLPLLASQLAFASPAARGGRQAR